jgi:hypothetical protein
MFLLSALCGCGKGPNTIDPAFQPLYNQFISDANSNGLSMPAERGVTIQFATLGNSSLGEIVGECSGYGYGNDTVLVDQGYWSVASSQAQFIIIYHELGHCLLAEQHTNTTAAIMNPLITNPLEFIGLDLSQMVKKLYEDIGNSGLNV